MKTPKKSGLLKKNTTPYGVDYYWRINKTKDSETLVIEIPFTHSEFSEGDRKKVEKQLIY